MRVLIVGVLWLAAMPFHGQTTSTPDAPTPASPINDPQWQHVRSLPSGELVELRDHATGIHTECILAFASVSAVGCDTGGPYDPPRRIVYARAEIDAVWVVRWVHGPSGRAMLIGTGIGALLGGLVAAQDGSSGSVAAGISLGGLIGLGCSNLGDPFHTRMSKRNHQVYRVR